MKKFRKTEEDFFVCEECGQNYAYKKGLAKHINKYHNGTHAYYDKWIKEHLDDKCKICGVTTAYLNFETGYKNGCSIECLNTYRQKYIESANLLKYNVKSSYERKDVVEKSKLSCFKNNGVEFPMQSKIIREKSKETCYKNNGVRYPLQNKNIHEKQQKTAYTLKKYNNTELWYQGTYELDFLEKFYKKYSDIVRGPSINYMYDGKYKVYHPDFFMPSENLIIEIKSSWVYDANKDLEKKKATINCGFKYIMIVNKNYSELEEIFRNL